MNWSHSTFFMIGGKYTSVLQCLESLCQGMVAFTEKYLAGIWIILLKKWTLLKSWELLLETLWKSLLLMDGKDQSLICFYVADATPLYLHEVVIRFEYILPSPNLTCGISLGMLL